MWNGCIQMLWNESILKGTLEICLVKYVLGKVYIIIFISRLASLEAITGDCTVSNHRGVSWALSHVTVETGDPCQICLLRSVFS